MLRLLFACMTAVAMLAAAVSVSVADHMNGTYYGTGEANGITLVLRQSGTSVTGQLSGSETGALNGQSDGADTVNGYLDTGGIRYQFIGIWSPSGFEIGLYDNLGNTEAFTFVPAGTAPTDDTPPPTETQYWLTDNGQQVGPLTLQQVLDRLASGESNHQTQVWTADLNQWVTIETVPELAAALPAQDEAPAQAENYYLYTDGVQTGPLSHEQVLLGIAQGTVSRRTLIWQPGQPEWMPIDSITVFAEAFPPAVPPPVQYFVIENGERVGPLNEEEMLARIAGTITSGDDLAWKKGLEAWAPVSTFPEFAEALAALDAPPVPPSLPGEDMPPAPSEDGPPPLPGDDQPAGDEMPPPLEEPAPPSDDVPPPVEEPPPATDDGPPAADETAEQPATDAEDPLLALLRRGIESDMADATAEEQEAAVACLAGVLEPLSAEHRQMLVDSGFEPSPEQTESLREAHPALQDDMNACMGIEPDVARSEVWLPDGRTFAVVGGSSHSVSSVDGGSEFVVDGVTIAFVNGALTVNGEAREVPAFSYILEAHVADGEVTLFVDP